MTMDQFYLTTRRSDMKRIILTGGGTAGHVTPNIALIPKLQELGYTIHYIGSYNGIEKELIAKLDIPYHGISSGKLRRYLSFQNITDIFRIVKGFHEAKALVRSLKPDVIFSKGGFVTVPVVRAGRRYKVPIIIHESDMTPGLANRLSNSSAWKVCCNFPETVAHLPKDKAVLTGLPMRKELLEGNALKGRNFLGFHVEKPILLVMGGSTGSVVVNEVVRKALPLLLEQYQVVHLCGKGKMDATVYYNGYRQYEYLDHELRDVLQACDLVVTRAGANAICELLALKKPNLLIPLSAKASRGDQILNAHSFEAQGYSIVIHEQDLTADSLIKHIEKLYQNRDQFISRMNQSKQQDAVSLIIDLIENA